MPSAPLGGSIFDWLRQSLGSLTAPPPIDPRLQRMTAPLMPFARFMESAAQTPGVMPLGMAQEGIPFRSSYNLFARPDLTLPEFGKGEQSLGAGLPAMTPRNSAWLPPTLADRNVPLNPEPGLSNPNAFKPVPGVKQNLGPIGDISVQPNLKSIAAEKATLPGGKSFIQTPWKPLGLESPHLDAYFAKLKQGDVGRHPELPGFEFTKDANGKLHWRNFDNPK